MHSYSQLSAQVDALWPRYRDALRELVRSPSVLGAETPAQHLVAGLAEAAGLDVEVWDVDPVALAADDRYAPVDGGEGVRPNVTAVLPGPGRRAVDRRLRPHRRRQPRAAGPVDARPVRWRHRR